MSTGEISWGLYHPGWRIGRPNHILDGDSSPGSRGVSIQKDHAWAKSSPVMRHFSQRRLNVLTVASARPLLWA